MAMRTSGRGGGLDSFKGSFFDRDAIMKAKDKAVRKNLSWFGGYVRRVVRNSIKEAKGVSAPGQPPKAHVAYSKPRKPTKRNRATKKRALLFRETILYAFDWPTETVLIGPFLFNGARTRPTVPEVLEKGGEVVVIKPKGQQLNHYRARPYMQPGFEKSLPKFRERLKGSIHK